MNNRRFIARRAAQYFNEGDTAGTWNTDTKINSVTFIKILSSSSGNKSSVIHLTYPPTDFS